MDFDQENDIIFWANIDLLKVRKGTLGKGLKYVQSNNKRRYDAVLVSLLLTLKIFHIFF